MSMPDDQETRSIFRLLLVVLCLSALIMFLGYVGKWVPGAP